MASTLTIVAAAGTIHEMTQLVFALVVTMGGQTISTEYWSGIETCLWYAKQLNKPAPPRLSPTPPKEREHPREAHTQAGLTLRTVEIFDR